MTIDPVHYEATYHLVPEVGAERQYALLVTALRRSGRVGIGRLVMRHKGHLCMVRPFGRGLVLTTLYYAEEFVSQDTLTELAVTGPRPAEQELEMVQRLIEAQSTPFEPRRYHDTHRERLLTFLERRARAQSRLSTRAPARVTPEEREGAAERKEVFARLEAGIASLREGGRKPQRVSKAATSQGSLRFRALAARETREHQPESPAGGRPRPGPGKHGLS